MLGSFLFKWCMLFSDFSNSWVGLTLQLRQLLFWDQKTRNSALVAARFPSGISPETDNLFREGPVLGPMGVSVVFVVSVWVVAGVKFFGQSGSGVPEAYLLNLLGFGQLSLGFCCFFFCWVESDFREIKVIPTLFLKRRCASRFSWIFRWKHESKNCLTLVYTWPFV